jgi:hypothetical protein
VQEAIAKTMVQAVIYPTLLAYLIWKAWFGPGGRRDNVAEVQG